MRIGNRSGGTTGLSQLGMTKKSSPNGKLVYDFLHSSVQSHSSTTVLEIRGCCRPERLNTGRTRCSIFSKSYPERKEGLRRATPGCGYSVAHPHATTSAALSPP